MSSETGFDPALLDRFPTSGPRPAGRARGAQTHLVRPARLGAADRGQQQLPSASFYVGAAFLFFVLAGVLALVMRVQLALPLQGCAAAGGLQPVLHRAWHADDVSLRGADDGSVGRAAAAADAGGARPAVSAAVRLCVLGLSHRRAVFLRLAVLRPCARRRLVHVSTADKHEPIHPGSMPTSGCSGSASSRFPRSRVPSRCLVGVLRTRAPGMTLARMPLFAWAMLVFAGMIVIAFPAVILATLLLELERALGWPFFDATRGGDPMLWQHLFWFFGHPEVYIIFLPAAGLVSMMVAALSRTALVGYELVVLAFLATGLHQLRCVGAPYVPHRHADAVDRLFSPRRACRSACRPGFRCSAGSQRLRSAGRATIRRPCS